MAGGSEGRQDGKPTGRSLCAAPWGIRPGRLCRWGDGAGQEEGWEEEETDRQKRRDTKREMWKGREEEEDSDKKEGEEQVWRQIAGIRGRRGRDSM